HHNTNTNLSTSTPTSAFHESDTAPPPDRSGNNNNNSNASPTFVPKKRRTCSPSRSPGSTDANDSPASDNQHCVAGTVSVRDSSDEPKVDYDAESVTSEGQSQAMEDIEPGHYPRFMLPRASGMSTMGEIHSLGPSPHNQSPAASVTNLVGYNQAQVYPARWHEYEDQFNYFYNCHFIEQDYYDFISSQGQHPSGDTRAEEETDTNGSIAVSGSECND
ncbi:hypothetical protein GGI22_007464, partial [Coemansia erecta]